MATQLTAEGMAPAQLDPSMFRTSGSNPQAPTLSMAASAMAGAGGTPTEARRSGTAVAPAGPGTAPAIPTTGAPRSQQPAQAPFGGMTFQQIDPANSLRSQNVLPGQDPRTVGVQRQVDQAAGNLQNFAGVPLTDISRVNAMLNNADQTVQGAMPVSADATAARDLASRSVMGLEAPNRGAIAADIFDQIRTQSAPAYQAELRDVGRRAASLGRIGAGMTTSELGDVQTRRDQYLTDAQRALSSEAAGLTLSDRLNVANTALGASGQFAGEDLSRAGFDLNRAGATQSVASQIENALRAQRGEAVDERNTAFDANRAALADLADLERMQLGTQASQRDELRTERGYEDALARTALDNRVNQTLMEDQLLNSRVNRENSRLNLLGSTAFGGVPTGVLQTGAANRADQASANQDAAAQIMAALAARNRGA